MVCLMFFLHCQDRLKHADDIILSLELGLGMQAVVTCLAVLLFVLLTEIMEQYSASAC